MSNSSKERRSPAHAAAFGDAFVRAVHKPLRLPEIPEGPIAAEVHAEARARLQQLLARRGSDGERKPPLVDPDILLEKGPARWEQVQPILDRFEVPTGTALHVADAWLPVLDHREREAQYSWSERARALLPVHALALLHARKMNLPSGPFAQADVFEHLWRRKDGEAALAPLSVVILQICRKQAAEIRRALPEDLLAYIFREEYTLDEGRVAFRFFPDSFRNYQSALAARVRGSAAGNGRERELFRTVLDEMRALSEHLDMWQRESESVRRFGGRLVSVPPHRPQPHKE